MTISSANHAAQTVEVRHAPSVEKTPPSRPDSTSAREDTVKISPAARAAVVTAQSASHAAVQEKAETRAQTAKHVASHRQAENANAKHASAAYKAAQKAA